MSFSSKIFLPTGINAPATTPSGSGVPTSLSTTSQRPRWRGVGLPQLLHTLSLVLGPKEEGTRGKWNPCWGELMPLNMSKALLLSGQCGKWKVLFLWCSKRDRCRCRIVFFQSWPITNSTQLERKQRKRSLTKNLLHVWRQSNLPPSILPIGGRPPSWSCWLEPLLWRNIYLRWPSWEVKIFQCISLECRHTTASIRRLNLLSKEHRSNLVFISTSHDRYI